MRLRPGVGDAHERGAKQARDRLAALGVAPHPEKVLADARRDVDGAPRDVAGVSWATEEERLGQDIFFGKGQCGACHQPPFYLDDKMHDLKVERFYTPQTINGQWIHAEGPIKTFTLRGIKDSPPYMHDGRLLTLEDTVEFFNLVLGVKLTPQEKAALVAYMRQL